jgi:acetoin utilization deacetylase AcuC-like enzyme
VSDHHWKRPDMSSSGFCLLNTAGVAAVIAQIISLYFVSW